ncbi:MAG: hypothetical protein H8E44_17865 [Planctomycetes bacterium]|nr:hypothetical protein [Planctomycetota bacterium]MBL7037616.1 hypothetical protein [Pirellulaceae bacterium]
MDTDSDNRRARRLVLGACALLLLGVPSVLLRWADLSQASVAERADAGISLEIQQIRQEADRLFVEKQTGEIDKLTSGTVPSGRPLLLSIDRLSHATREHLFTAFGAPTEEITQNAKDLATCFVEVECRSKRDWLVAIREFPHATNVFQFLIVLLGEYVLFLSVLMLCAASVRQMAANAQRHRPRTNRIGSCQQRSQRLERAAFGFALVALASSVCVVWAYFGIVVTTESDLGGASVGRVDDQKSRADYEARYGEALSRLREVVDAPQTRQLLVDWEEAQTHLRAAHQSSQAVLYLDGRLRQREQRLMWLTVARSVDVGVKLFVVVIVLGLFWRTGRRITKSEDLEDQEEAAKCPSCRRDYGERKTETRIASKASVADVNTNVTCKNEVRWRMDERPRTCDFTIRKDRLALRRLCFTLIGEPDTGKSFWLTVAFKRLIQEHKARRLKVWEIETEGLQDLKRNLENFAKGRREPIGTPRGLSKPVLFEITERVEQMDPNRFLVSLFDCAGEEIRTLADNQSAGFFEGILEADGYLLFLDPRNRNRFEEQAQGVRKLIEGVEITQRKVPLAICLTMIDALDSWQPLLEVDKFLDKLREIDEDVTLFGKHLQLIEERSKATASFIESSMRELFVHVNVGRAFDKYRYFPVTSTGFTQEGDPMYPYSVLEPLLWLISVSGYNSFPCSYNRSDDGSH